ncbi:metallophosphoesterase [Paenibacillus naphthalenovorans]|uniref:Metallophosphoesterase n=1 Tax=Paenibacillus naphthalenovorans TaxID=162209 RepID=A0A0U2VRI1_9BACL|nr:metallophosphoesterase [Paenibacillus naphthalenovorans]
MKRKLVISDIHGCYEEFNELLALVKYNPSEDRLILLGDYIDRGLKSKEVVEQVKALHEEWGVITLKGNHDQMFLDSLDNQDDSTFLYNGGLDTINSYCGVNWFEDGFTMNRFQEAKQFIQKHYGHHIDFLKSLSYYHEDDEYIYVHAGLNPLYENWKEQPKDNFLWTRDVFLNNPTLVDKTVIFGHTPTINMQETEDIWFTGDKIGIDGGCCFGLQLNCLEINDEDGYKQYYVESKNKRRK